MTRINVVPVEELCDQHLRSEWREITRIPNKLLNGKLKDNPFKIPHVLPYADDETGKDAHGHEYFFTNKLQWLRQRYEKVIKECERRGFNCPDRWPNHIFKDHFWDTDWEPSEDDLMNNRKRIKQNWPKNPKIFGKEWR